MKKKFFLWIFISLFSFILLWWFFGVNAAESDDYTLKLNSKAISKDKVLIINWAFSGDYKEFDIYSSIDWDYFRLIDTVEIKKWTYNYYIPCWIQLFWFKFVPKAQVKVKGKKELKYWKIFDYKTNVNWAWWNCRILQSAADSSKLWASYLISWNTIVLNWTALSWSTDIEVKVSKNGSDTYTPIAIVPITDESFTYTVWGFDKSLKFALVPRNLYGQPYLYEDTLYCFDKLCSPEKNTSSSMFWVIYHTIDTKKNQIIFWWNNKLAWTNLDISLVNSWVAKKIDTIKLLDWKYVYKLSCDDTELNFRFSIDGAEWMVFDYNVEVNSDNLNCPKKDSLVTGPNTKILSSNWYWFAWWDQLEKVSNWYTRELDNAFKFWSYYKLTSAYSIEYANMDWNITRAAMAKMISNFAKNALWLKPDSSISCSFPDVPEDLDQKFWNWITEACQLWIMWIGIENFKPYDTVYRAEFWTILSRLIFWLEDWFPYYQPHLHKLYETSIMKNIEPYKIEKRWNVLLMLMRAAQQIWIADGTYSKYTISTTESVTSKIDEEKLLFTIVELVNPKLLDLAKQVLLLDWNSENYKWAWADLTSANICHTHATWTNTINFYWDPVILSDNVEIRLYSKDNNFESLEIVPMNYWNFKYDYTGKDKELIFSFTPRNAKWKEITYKIDFRNGSWDINCQTSRTDITDEVKTAINWLWKASDVLWMLVPSLREKDSKVIKNLKELLQTYIESDNEFNKNLWTYLTYILNNL